MMLLTLCFAIASCDSKKNQDSTDMAEEQNDARGNDDTEKDADFAVEAANAGLLEVQLGTLGTTKATSARVKQFAQMMVDDHTKANNELKALASEKGIALPDVINEDAQKEYYDLEQKEKGNEFDKEFMDQMVEDHREVIRKFEREADNGNDPDVKAWAAGKLAALRHHLEEAERIQESLKDSNTARNN